MTFAPAPLTKLAAFYKAHGGVPLGIVGNTAHTVGYHLGKDRIFDGTGPGLGANDYSVKLARDKAGLTNAASAIDLGKINASLAELRTFSKWLVAACTAEKAGYRDVREIIYSPDGVKVQRWSGEDGQIHTGPGNGDDSHRFHTHVSYYRDSESRDKIALFSPYFTSTPTEDTMPDLSSYLPGYSAVLKATSNVRATPAVGGALIRTVPAGKTETWIITGYAKGGPDTDGACTTTDWPCRWAGGRWEYTSFCNLTGAPTPPAPVPVPPDAASCKPFSDAAYTKGVADGTVAGSRAEWDRQSAGATVAVELLPRP
jgi:hypothetical protein